MSSFAVPSHHIKCFTCRNEGTSISSFETRRITLTAHTFIYVSVKLPRRNLGVNKALLFCIYVLHNSQSAMYHCLKLSLSLFVCLSQALHQLYYDPNIENKNLAQKWLMQAQVSPQAWQFCWVLLRPEKVRTSRSVCCTVIPSFSICACPLYPS